MTHDPEDAKALLEEERRRRAPIEPEAHEAALGRARAREFEDQVLSARVDVFGAERPEWDGPDDDRFLTWHRQYLKDVLGGRRPDHLTEWKRALADATGFLASDVGAWILHDEPPKLHRLLVDVDDRKCALPDGTYIRRRRITATFNGAVQDGELRDAYRRLVRPALDPDVDAVHVARRAEGRDRMLKLNDLDDHLLQVRRHVIESGDGWTWPDVHREWRASPPDWWTKSAREWRTSGPGNVQWRTLYQRWKRLIAKFPQLEDDQ